MMMIGLLALLAVGPDRLPTMIKTVSRSYRQLRRTATDLRASTGIDQLLADEELKELAEFRKQKLSLMSAPAKKAPPGTEPARIDGKPVPPMIVEEPAEGVDIAEMRHELGT